jgi:5-methylcytosine-specific restriction endonuclease McrA
MSEINDTSDIPQFKACTKCGETLPATTEFFVRQKTGKYGLTAECKACQYEYQRKYREENREKIRESDRRYYEENGEKRRESMRQYREKSAEKIRESDRRYREENREAINERNRQWRAENPEQQRKYCELNSEKRRERKRKWNAENGEAALEYQRIYRAEHPEKVRDNARAAYHRRRARKLAVGGTFTAADIQLQYASQNGKCWWCGCNVKDDFHVDHVIPLARGGSNNPENLVISCAPCNLSKGAKLPHEFSGRLF